MVHGKVGATAAAAAAQTISERTAAKCEERLSSAVIAVTRRFDDTTSRPSVSYIATTNLSTTPHHFIL